MSYSHPEGLGRRGRICVYRSAALSTGSSGAWVVLPWDGESTVPAKYKFTHSAGSELITCDQTDNYKITAAIKIVAGTWNEFRGSLEIDGVAIETPNCGASGGLLGLSPGPSTLVISRPVRIAKDSVIRLRIASVNQGSVALDVGETDTWLDISPSS